jgi:putative DNA primase/helicase
MTTSPANLAADPDWLMFADDASVAAPSLEPPPTSLLPHALACVERGWYVFPLLPGKKEPATAHGFKDASNDPGHVSRWWTEDPRYNIGIACGASNLCVLDFDDPSALGCYVAKASLPDTFTVKTSRGVHKYLAGVHPSGNLFVKGEIKSAGGYVVGPGSIHPDGSVYTIIENRPLAPTPNVILRDRPHTRQENGPLPRLHPEFNREIFEKWAHLDRGGTLRRSGLEYLSLKTCPLDDKKHSNQTTAKSVLIYGNGTLGFSCFADQCGSRGIGELLSHLRGKFGPCPCPIFDTSATDKTGSDNSLNVITASDVEPELIDWLWESRVPFGKLTLFSGNPDLGKSLTTLDVVSRITTGRDWPDSKNTAPPCDVLVLTAEDAPGDTIVPRLMAADADLHKVHFLQSTKVAPGKQARAYEREFALDTDIQLLRTFLATHPEIRLIVVDPISNYLGAASINKEQEVRNVLTPLVTLMKDTGCAGLTVGHFNKTLGIAAISKTSGAVGLVGIQRMAWGFMKSEDEPGITLMLRVKGNISKANIKGLRYRIKTKPVTIRGVVVEQPVIAWDGNSEESADTMLQLASNPEETKTRRATLWIEETLANAGERRLASEIYALGEQAGFAGTTLKEGSKRSQLIKKYNEGGGWFWEITKDPSLFHS